MLAQRKPEKKNEKYFQEISGYSNAFHQANIATKADNKCAENTKILRESESPILAPYAEKYSTFSTKTKPKTTQNTKSVNSRSEKENFCPRSHIIERCLEISSKNAGKKTASKIPEKIASVWKNFHKKSIKRKIQAITLICKMLVFLTKVRDTDEPNLVAKKIKI